jgi:hypothetical protein
MLYESDINKLLSQWTERLTFQTAEQPYKDAVRDCIYDLRMLTDKQFQEECLANEAFEQQLREDEHLWNEYLSASYAGDGVVMA